MRVGELRTFMNRTFHAFPWELEITDWTGGCWSVGGAAGLHWCGEPLRIHLRTPAGGADLLRHDAMSFLERFVRGALIATEKRDQPSAARSSRARPK
mgnify:CR=1 FL=1